MDPNLTVQAQDTKPSPKICLNIANFGTCKTKNCRRVHNKEQVNAYLETSEGKDALDNYNKKKTNESGTLSNDLCFAVLVYGSCRGQEDGTCSRSIHDLRIIDMFSKTKEGEESLARYVKKKPNTNVHQPQLCLAEIVYPGGCNKKHICSRTHDVDAVTKFIETEKGKEAFERFTKNQAQPKKEFEKFCFQYMHYEKCYKDCDNSSSHTKEAKERFEATLLESQGLSIKYKTFIAKKASKY
jgi:hypothetical protein